MVPGEMRPCLHDLEALIVRNLQWLMYCTLFTRVVFSKISNLLLWKNVGGWSAIDMSDQWRLIISFELYIALHSTAEIFGNAIPHRNREKFEPETSASGRSY